MNIVAIDPGNKMGFAKHIEGEAVEARALLWEIDSKDPPGLKWSKFRGWLNSVTHSGKEWPDERIDLLVVEAPIGKAQKSLNSNRSALAWNTIAEEVAATHGINYVEIHAVTVKKFATGTGRADKELMLAAAYLKWPHFFPPGIKDLHITGEKKVGKKTVNVWNIKPDPTLFEISDVLWLLQYARENVEIINPVS